MNIPVKISTNSKLFPLFQQEIKKVKPYQTEHEVIVTNNQRSKLIKKKVTEKYRFEFQWLSDDICAVEMFRTDSI